jgi:putrescine transport system substrate-binding protein
MMKSGQMRVHTNIIFAVSVLWLWSCSTDRAAETASGEKVVNVYNWAEYIAPDTIEKFEAEYGIKVNYDIYDSSAVVDVKLLAGNSGYDVVVHSSQFSSRLVPIGVYEQLDYSRLDNIRHMDQELIEKIDIYEPRIWCGNDSVTTRWTVPMSFSIRKSYQSSPIAA